MTTSIKVLLTLGAATLGLSHLGALHPLGDALAVFRLPIVAGVLGLGALVWRWRGAQVMLALAVLSLLSVVMPRLPVAAPRAEMAEGGLTLYQKNLLYRPTDRSAFLAEVEALAPDFITLQEVSQANRQILEDLSGSYKHQLICGQSAVGAVAILSRWPLGQPDCGADYGLAMATAQVDGTAVQVASIHLPWPFPFRQQAYVRQVLARELTGAGDIPTLIGGDFNMVPEGATLRWIERATGTRRVGVTERTFELYGYPLAIDHVLATGGQGSIEVRPRLGSDHFGVLARVDLPG